ncbi:hypothetical protein Q5P01_023352 [Channa striata]|uniref:Uncharacterized protein n=1 Tax=Channa striata TaxID=64152 RepID=A0AA88J657_CHASR|nr:hypothetical protein Q5P01_023352 [Channa striata]
MDGIDTLQSSALETKAERIARYKAERRKELAERYGNTDDFSSKYVRRDRKTGDASEMLSSATKEKEKNEDNGSETTYTRRGLRNKVAEPVEHPDFEPAKEKETLLKSDTVLSSKSEAGYSVKTSSHLMLLETNDTEEPKVHEKPVDSAKGTVTSTMSIFQDQKETEDGSCGQGANNKVKRQLAGSDEEEASSSLFKSDKDKAMEEEEEATNDPTQEQGEYAATTEGEKCPSLLSDSKNRNPSPPLSPSCHLQRQDSGTRGIKGILKKSRSTSVESDQSESSTQEYGLARHGSITLSHHESKEDEMEEDEEEQAKEEEQEEEEED